MQPFSAAVVNCNSEQSTHINMLGPRLLPSSVFYWLYYLLALLALFLVALPDIVLALLAPDLLYSGVLQWGHYGASRDFLLHPAPGWSGGGGG